MKKGKQITVKSILDKRYEKSDAKYPIKLRVTFDRKQKYYGTKYSMTEAEWFKMTVKHSESLRDTLFDLQNEVQRATKIAEKLKPFNWDLFEKKFLSIYDSTTLTGAFDSAITELNANGQPGTASVYENAKNSLNRFKADMMLQDVTVKFLKEYEKWMIARSPTTVSMYLRTLRTVINSAIKEGGFPAEDYPFGEDKFSPPVARGNKRWLPIETIAKIYNYKGQYEKAKDFWLFSFFTNGMNMKDIVRLRYSNIDTDQNIISYKRSKTVRTKRVIEDISIDYTDDLKLIVEKYGTGKDYIFPILYEGITPKRERELVQLFIHVINNGLKNIAEDLKIKTFTSYSARHSWAVVQRDAGLSIVMISKGLGHSSTKVTDDYLGSLDVKTMRQVSKNLTAFKEDFAKVVNM